MLTWCFDIQDLNRLAGVSGTCDFVKVYLAYRLGQISCLVQLLYLLATLFIGIDRQAIAIALLLKNNKVTNVLLVQILLTVLCICMAV